MSPGSVGLCAGKFATTFLSEYRYTFNHMRKLGKCWYMFCTLSFIFLSLTWLNYFATFQWQLSTTRTGERQDFFPFLFHTYLLYIYIYTCFFSNSFITKFHRDCRLSHSLSSFSIVLKVMLNLSLPLSIHQSIRVTLLWACWRCSKLLWQSTYLFIYIYIYIYLCGIHCNASTNDARSFSYSSMLQRSPPSCFIFMAICA